MNPVSVKVVEENGQPFLYVKLADLEAWAKSIDQNNPGHHDRCEFVQKMLTDVARVAIGMKPEHFLP